METDESGRTFMAIFHRVSPAPVMPYSSPEIPPSWVAAGRSGVTRVLTLPGFSATACFAAGVARGVALRGTFAGLGLA